GYPTYTTGAGTQSTGYIDSEAVTLTSAVTVSDFQVYVFNPGSGTGGIALYNDGGNKPGTLLTGTTFTPASGWNDVPMPGGTYLLSPATYWLSWSTQNQLGVQVDTTSSVGRYQSVWTWSSWPPATMPAGSGNNGFSYAIYM